MTIKFFGILVIICIGTSAKNVKASVFELVDQYVGEFEKELHHLTTYMTVKSSSQTKNEPFLFDRTDLSKRDVGEYDFIIIGAGTSGSVIVNRLSEIPEWKILVLEAGDVETKATKVPYMHPFLKTANSPYTWGYYSTPQNKSCLDMLEGRCYIPTAKIFGGTTAINDMVYTRGNQRDYDLWADTGLQGWCWQSLFPYFKKIEDAHFHGKKDPKFHHYGGPVILESSRNPSHITNNFLEGGKEIGLNEIDINGQHAIGLGIPQLMTKFGERFSASEAYLLPSLRRTHVTIKPLSQVTKIIISEHTKEGRGVEFLHDGKLFTASAKKEIILAAGAINSAKLLLLSGVGPEEDLKTVKVDPIMDLKVGQKLIDQTLFPMRYGFNQTDSRELPFCYNKEVEYLKANDGPLTYTGVDLIGFIKTEYSKGKALYPDVELLITGNKFDQPSPNLDIRFENDEHRTGFTINLILLHPKSRGNMKLKDNDPLQHPFIDLNSLSDENDDDIDTILSAIRTIQKLVNTHHMKKIGIYLEENHAPQCQQHEPDSDDYWRCAIRHFSSSMGHVSGSAPMGIGHDENYADSVVDSKLKVHGIDKLRVADESVVPVSISGNLAALKIVIGEKCADLIKEEWLK